MNTKMTYKNCVDFNHGKTEIKNKFDELKEFFESELSDLRPTEIMASDEDSDMEIAETIFLDYVNELYNLNDKVVEFKDAVDSVISECKTEAKKYNIGV